MSIEKELDYAYKLITERFSIYFEKPSLILGDRGILDLYPPRSLKEFLRPVAPLLYNDKNNTILISDEVLEGNSYLSKSFGLLHELGHAYQSYQNKAYGFEVLQELLDSNVAENMEKAVANIFFQEGHATVMAIRSCESSGIENLERVGEMMDHKMKDAVSKEGLKELNLNFLSKFYNIPEDDWQRLIHAKCKANLETVSDDKYHFGYFLASQLSDDELVRSVLTPPIILEHIFYPEKYKTTLNP